MDILHLRDRDLIALFDVSGTGVTTWYNDYPEADNGRIYPPTNEKCLGLIAQDGRFFAVRLIFGDNLQALAQRAFGDAELRLAREFEEREQPGPDDYHSLFGEPPVIKPTGPSRKH